ncbi:hypothetical protein APS67_002493 [Streptomyces sp. AVP053U2]|nr:hypothetical protein APS67_002493 [Streptomyces sp. AVP053U2]
MTGKNPPAEAAPRTGVPVTDRQPNRKHRKQGVS